MSAAHSPAAADPSMTPQGVAYRDEHLGPWSSHPYWLATGGRRLRQAAVLALIVLYLIAFYLWLRGLSLEELLPKLLEWWTSQAGRVTSAVVAFSFGVLVAGSFQLRWALRKHGDQSLAPSRERGVRYNVAMIIAVGIAGLAIPLLLTFSPQLPLEFRLVGPLLALLPVSLLSYLLPSQGDPRTPFPWISLLVLAPLLWFIVIAANVADWLQQVTPAWLSTHLPVLATPEGWRRAAFAMAASVTLYGVIRLALWRRAQPLEPEPLPSPPAGEGVPAADATEWIAALATQLGLPTPEVSLQRPDARETADWQSESPYEVFFDSQPPTQDQHRALQDFVALSDAALTGREDGAATSGFEMVLEGSSGAGRSMTLDAIALLSAVARGAKSVLLVPDDGRVGLAVERLRRKLERLGLDEFVTVDSLDATWTATRVAEAPPDICVTTPELWETLLPGNLTRDAGQRERIRRLMCLYTTVLVDDWLAHPILVRLHLPFIVDKHRLLLESEMLPSARVYVFPPLSDTGRALVMDRLIGHSGMLAEARQVARLRYRRDLVAAVWDIDTEIVDEMIGRVTDGLCQIGQPSILLREGIDAGEAARQTEELRTRFPQANITVCYCHDQVDALVGGVSSVVTRSAQGPDAVFALRARCDSDGPVIIRIRGSRALPAPVRITPLIVDRSGRGMVEAHLLSILPFVSERTPIPRRSWGQLGVASVVGSEVGQPRAAARLLLDRPEDVAEPVYRDRPYLRRLGAFMALDEPLAKLAAVDCHWVPAPALAWWTSGGDTRYGPAALNLPVLEESIATRRTTVMWKGNEGAELGRSQLHYADELLLRRRQIFCPEVLRPDPSGGMEVLAARFRNDGRDAIHPKLALEWQTSIAARESRRPEAGSGGPNHGYLWVDFPQAAGEEITARLIERTDEFDRPTPCFNHEFSYRAFVRALLLGPTAETVERQSDFREALLDLSDPSVTWGTTHPQFLPGLSYALSRGFEIDLPSSGFLGKMLAFRLTGRLARYAQAVVWFVEPAGTGTTLSNAVQELVRAEDYLERLSRVMDRILAQGWDKSPTGELARFWLPRSLRKAILHFERRLVDGLAPVSTATPSLPATRRRWRWRVTCPHCGAVTESESASDAGMESIRHCGQVISLLVPTTDGRRIMPHKLLTPWWPAGVTEPEGSVPDRIRAVWQIVGRQLEYARDRQQSERQGECWLAPAETWARGRGDCEDHAALVVAMLRFVGVDCSLTWGTLGGEGHAWVEAELDGRAVLIEATAKEPLPPGPPAVAEAAAVYGDPYAPAAGLPARTDGVGYAQWQGSEWIVVALVEPEELPATLPQ